MFSLIITIISIALVAALAVATIYFGGDAFNQGSARAAAATLVNQASQISGANTLYFLDNQAFAEVADLDPQYLASVPSAGNAVEADVDGNLPVWSVDTDTGTVSIEGVKTAVCDQVMEQAGSDDAQFRCADGVFSFGKAPTNPV